MSGTYSQMFQLKNYPEYCILYLDSKPGASSGAYLLGAHPHQLTIPQGMERSPR